MPVAKRIEVLGTYSRRFMPRREYYPVELNRKKFEASSKGQHVANGPDSHSLGCIFSIPGWLQDPSELHTLRRDDFLGWRRGLDGQLANRCQPSQERRGS